MIGLMTGYRPKNEWSPSHFVTALGECHHSFKTQEKKIIAFFICYILLPKS